MDNTISRNILCTIWKQLTLLEAIVDIKFSSSEFLNIKIFIELLSYKNKYDTVLTVLSGTLLISLAFLVQTRHVALAKQSVDKLICSRDTAE